jgi:hypothetical protein
MPALSGAAAQDECPPSLRRRIEGVEISLHHFLQVFVAGLRRAGSVMDNRIKPAILGLAPFEQFFGARINTFSLIIVSRANGPTKGEAIPLTDISPTMPQALNSRM